MYFENFNILFASADAKLRTSILNTMFYKLYVFRKKNDMPTVANS